MNEEEEFNEIVKDTFIFAKPAEENYLDIDDLVTHLTDDEVIERLGVIETSEEVEELFNSCSVAQRVRIMNYFGSNFFGDEEDNPIGRIGPTVIENDEDFDFKWGMFPDPKEREMKQKAKTVDGIVVLLLLITCIWLFVWAGFDWGWNETRVLAAVTIFAVLISFSKKFSKEQ